MGKSLGLLRYLILINLLLVAGGSVAQTSTVSTLVGVQKQTTSEGLQILADPFAGASNNITATISNALPLGSKVYFFDAASQGYSTVSEYTPISGGYGEPETTNWTVAVPVSDADGFWVSLAEGAGTNEYLALGEVPSAAEVTNVLMSGVNLVSYPYPVDTAVSNLSMDASIGDKIWAWDGGTYAVSEYTIISGGYGEPETTNWANPGLEIGMGEGFWYQANSQIEWIESRPYDL